MNPETQEQKKQRIETFFMRLTEMDRDIAKAKGLVLRSLQQMYGAP